MDKSNHNTKVVGNFGEDKAARYLFNNGYKIIARNWRTRHGEIDIIAITKDILVFVEVKTLPSGNAETLARELDKRKQKRIIETSKFFLLTNREYSNRKIRFDVVVVDMPGFDSVYHIQDAFSEFV
ncbi:YraN family protein [Treponema zioleckii]|uniref:YraN family protein n=1 Tax=Treponema zioleckii TaxID=331680 RepID=UPI00168A7229|nr:YraN family protein [Treponema zioleckii]